MWRIGLIYFLLIAFLNGISSNTRVPFYHFEPNGSGTYAFGYEIKDNRTGNNQFREEEKLRNGTIRGIYGYIRPDGFASETTYIADKSGYHVVTDVSNRPKPQQLIVAAEDKNVSGKNPTHIPTDILDSNIITVIDNISEVSLASPEIDGTAVHPVKDFLPKSFPINFQLPEKTDLP